MLMILSNMYDRAFLENSDELLAVIVFIKTSSEMINRVLNSSLYLTYKSKSPARRRSAFVFNINLLILSAFSLTSFLLAEASLSAFSQLYTLVCALVQKYHEMSFNYNYPYFQYSFCYQPVLFAQLENGNKLWNNNRSHVTFKLTTGSIVPFSPQTMQWYH